MQLAFAVLRQDSLHVTCAVQRGALPALSRRCTSHVQCGAAYCLLCRTRSTTSGAQAGRSSSSATGAAPCCALAMFTYMCVRVSIGMVPQAVLEYAPTLHVRAWCTWSCAPGDGNHDVDSLVDRSACCHACVCVPAQGAGKGKALEFILKELKEADAYPEAGVQVGGGCKCAAVWRARLSLAPKLHGTCGPGRRELGLLLEAWVCRVGSSTQSCMEPVVHTPRD
jgi:hypothetical protein